MKVNERKHTGQTNRTLYAIKFNYHYIIGARPKNWEPGNINC